MKTTPVRLRPLSLAASAVLLVACAERILEPPVQGAANDASLTKASTLDAPGSATATGISETEIDVSWADNTSGETKFEIHRSTTGANGTFTLLATVGANVTRYGDQQLAPGATVSCYEIRAVRVTGGKTVYSSFSNTACAVPPSAAPTNATAAGFPWPRVDLTWHDNSSVETWFLILRSTDGENGTFAETYWAAANQVSASDFAVVTGTRYCYRIQALREDPTTSAYDFVYSPPSNTTCARPPPPSQPPPSAYELSARSTTSTSVLLTLKWTDNSMPPPAFRSYRSTDGGAGWTLISLSGGANGEYYDSPVASEHPVCYRVVAYNVAGDAAPSNQACTTPPAAPTNLVARVLDSSTLELTWNDNSSVEDGYEVWMSLYRASYYCYPPGSTGQDAGIFEWQGVIASLGPSATSFRVTGSYPDNCDPPTSYSFWVVAKKDGGSSTASNTVSTDDLSMLP